MLDHGPIDNIGNEAERSFATDHQVDHDVKGISKIDQSIQAVTGGIFNLEFIAYTLGKHFIGQHPYPHFP